jgi:hypothetical protein
MPTEIISNGSKWAGEEPDSIDTLLDVLAKHPLDRTFEAYGNFVLRDPQMADGSRDVGRTHFFGNFLTLSHVFSIRTDEQDVIDKLTAAIQANKLRPDYRNQSKPKRPPRRCR